ncbi:ABC transporter permease subunit [Leptolyngbya sp. FACHB-261]|nr:ABC transporter permease subunit [Leptolyngbya sp. FACHB-261]
MLTVLAVALLLWFPLSVLANLGRAQELLKTGAQLPCGQDLFRCSQALTTPAIPSPLQFLTGVLAMSWPLSKDTIPLNWLATAGATLVGLALALVVGAVIAVLLVQFVGFERAVLPWVVASQVIPIIALAPMLAVLLGRYGVEGLLPKALIAAYIAFFPITIGLAKGLRSVSPLSADLMRTYNADTFQVYRLLRLPTALPFLFTGLKVGAAAALVGTMIAEIATVNFRGLGTMILGRAYFADTVGLWVLMFASALLGIALVGMVNFIERWVTPWQMPS